MSSADGVGLESTPTYSVAVTALFFISISLIVERAIHRLKKYLKRKNQKPLRKVLDKMTEELMLLGFISLLLTVLQSSLVKICVSPGFSSHLLPCGAADYASVSAPAPSAVATTLGRRLLNIYLSAVDVGPRRQLMAESLGTGRCAAKGQVPFVSVEVLHQLHIFIFVLAITHVCYSLATVLLGFARLHNWRRWEEQTRERGYDGNLDLQRRYCRKILCEKPPLLGISGHANVFVDRHANHWCYENPISLWMLCFFQQFFASVSREDYLTFRVGFLNKHNLGDSFNFRDYVVRSMEVDFKKVLGISWWLWLVVVLFLLLNVHGWYTYFWMAFIPTVLVLVIGTKQQHIISTLALQAKRHAAQILANEAKANGEVGKSSIPIVDIAPAVSPSDQLFWFDNPKLLLRLLHFIIFQNSFELAIFFWLVTTFGWKSCILGNHVLLIVRVVVGIATQLLCSYSTLPIYALVTQMGTTLKQTVFTKDVFEGLVGWRQKAIRNRAKRSSASTSEENSEVFSNEQGSTKDESTTTDDASPEVGGGKQLERLATGRQLERLATGRQLERLTTAPREGMLRKNDADPDADPDASLRKMCQMMYGKKDGLEKIAAAKVTPSSFRELREEEEDKLIEE
ncbi:unnamed protein product [Calypogeia fissa]